MSSRLGNESLWVSDVLFLDMLESANMKGRTQTNAHSVCFTSTQLCSWKCGLAVVSFRKTWEQFLHSASCYMYTYPRIKHTFLRSDLIINIFNKGYLYSITQNNPIQCFTTSRVKKLFCYLYLTHRKFWRFILPMNMPWFGSSQGKQGMDIDYLQGLWEYCYWMSDRPDKHVIGRV